jgi:putative NADPH-quinone reductase
MWLERAVTAGSIARAGRASRRILIVNGHPDPRPERFCAALCDAYQAGADLGGQDAERLDVGALGFGAERFLCVQEVDAAVRRIRAASRLIIVFPLWLDRAPAILRGLFDRLAADVPPAVPREVSTIITMEMPAFAHRALARHAGSSGLVQGLALPGIANQDPLFIGGIDTISPSQRISWLRRMQEQGYHGR